MVSAVIFQLRLANSTASSNEIDGAERIFSEP
jgi:hypothetical protein